MAEPVPEAGANERPSLIESLDHLRPWLLGGVSLLIVLLLAKAAHGLISELSYDHVIAAVRATPGRDLVLALLGVVLSYAALTGFDHSSLRYVGVRLPYPVIAQTSFIAYALGNTIGLGVLTGGAVRLRLYAAAGVEAGQISRAIAFNAAAFGIGITVVGAAAVLWGARAVAPALHLPAVLLQTGGVLVLAATLIFLTLCGDGRQREIAGYQLRLPALGLALRQLLFSALDIAGAALVLWLLLPDHVVGFAAFVGFFSIAIVLGVISHVPGGLGVFEAVMLVALGGRASPEVLAGALLLYRLIYFVLPLLLALALLVYHETRESVLAPVGRALVSLAPLLLAAFTLIIGIMLLISGVTPATDEATELLALNIPLPLVEASHFLGSIAGLGLLFVARGMLDRLDAAWWAGLLLGLLALALALPKGIAVSEAVLLTFLIGALVASRRQFTRRASLLAQPFTGGWLVSMGVIVGAITWLLFFVYRDVEYSDELWWQFAFNAHAPRSLRALLAIVLIALAIALRQLLRPPSTRLAEPDAAALERVSIIVRAQDCAEAHLALSGDKHFLFSDSGKAFVMYGRRARSWVGLFDPVGPQGEWPELVWRFLELAREQGGRASFYQVRPRNLPVYLDAGLRLYKLGEHAYVPLTDFSLKGKRRANLRHGVSRAEREGLGFELIPVEGVAAALPELKALSDGWLAQQNGAEKGFSLGAFEESYLLRSPVAVVRRHGQVLAFASVMATEQKLEANVDLMRAAAEVPPGTMDFLFAQLMLQLQAQGYQRFGLGMAPLSGMAEHPLASGWHRFGRLLFAHGAPFYNFQGLRAFKEKFDPQWEARYLAAPGGMAPLFVLADTAALISGGFRGVIAR